VTDDGCQALVAQARNIDWTAVVDAIVAAAGDADGEESDRLIELGRAVLRFSTALGDTKPRGRLTGRQVARARLGI
jgi:hypothetical protein